MKSLMHGAFIGFGIFTLCSTLAVADVHEKLEASPQVPESTIHTAKESHVDSTELHHFAASILAIRPIDKEAHQKLDSKNLTITERHQLLAQYGKKVIHVLSHHHLTPVRYERLLTKAQTDPTFAQRTAVVLKTMKG